jgi:ribonuclease VapC
MVIDTSALLATAAVTPVPLEESHVLWAFNGWRRYGKGRHPAALNFGDCFSYGLACSLQAPLFFKGDDFAATDLEPALPG